MRVLAASSFTIAMAIFLSKPCLSQTAVVPPSVRPAAITAGIPTNIIVSALVTSAGPQVIANGVNVLQVDQNGANAKVIGTLNDSGLNGDSIAGDGIFSGTVTLNQAVVGQVYLRLSAAFSGTLRRTLSPITQVLVTAPGVPNAPAPSSTQTTLDPQTGTTVVCNELLASFQPGTNQSSIGSAIQSIGGTLVGMLAQFGIYQVTIPSCDGTSLNAALIALAANPVVNFVELNGVGTMTQVTGTVNDQYFLQGKQWGLGNINASRAWTLAQAAASAQGRTLASGVAIGIIDTGVNGNHEDLLGQVTPGINWCASVDSNRTCTFSEDTSDDFGHGTMVAGIAAAITNNGLGIASPAFRARLIAEKVTIPGSATPIDDAVALAITDAVSRGARVINISLTFGLASHAINLAILDATTKGVVIVASAGNIGNSTLLFPAAYSTAGSVISIGASDQNNQRAVWPLCLPLFSGSNYGSWVSLYAPGSNIFGLLYNQTSGPLAYGYYGSLLCTGDGTSFAAPFVAGTASLMLAVNPSLIPAQVKQFIVNSATPTGNIDPLGNPVNVLNAFGAVELAIFGKPGVTYTVLPIPIPAGWTGVRATNINSSGQVVGSGFIGSTQRPFVATSQSFQSTPLPAGFTTGVGLSINSGGQVVGSAASPSVEPNIHAFIDTSGGSLVVPFSGTNLISSAVWDINDSGQMIGVGETEVDPFPSQTSAYIGSVTGMIPLPQSQDWRDTLGIGINNVGQIVGHGLYRDAPFSQVFLGDSSGIKSVVPLPSDFHYFEVPQPNLFTRTIKINDSGQIVGTVVRSSDEAVGVFVSTATTTMLIPIAPDCPVLAEPSLNNVGQVVFTNCIWDVASGARSLNDLVLPGWLIYSADGINDKGQIVALAVNFNLGFYGLVILDPQ